ncbi:sensor histidine kinase [Salegentibacter sp. BDJ18]|uniref:tetratricopeptide repeat-containing sensor histidine kinase n=1 Tax=Salegentibacter sp. BDJ18 TaxID=2816376 RepID=UPI001AB01489|nr:sensor histidine kinase [Salegentibacter sp. BDJ18]MBO2543793.1 sensor histidine kinase [Salegentibacter sp. BDJ18]
MYLRICLLLFFLITSCNIDKTSNSTQKYNNLKQILLDEKEPNARNRLLNKIPDDSLKNKLQLDLAYEFYLKEDSTRFRYWNSQAKKMAINLDLEANIALTNWDLGNFFYRDHIIDSSYYHYNLAYEQFLKADKDLKAGRMLLNMAILQEKVKDYIGSENTTFQALDLIEESTDSQNYVYPANNNLGIIYNGLGDYSQALKYHRAALKNAEFLEDPVKSARSLNNLGVVYQKLGDHNNSILNYTKALQIDSILQKDTELYAMLTDNLGYSEFKLGNYQVASFLFHTALKIRDSIQHESGIVINKLHLGEYYLKNSDTTKALQYTKEANSLANTTSNNRDLLASYSLLAKIEPQKAPEYLDSYIQLNDSLLQEERAIRNKFARIRFETDQYIQKTQELSNEKLWLSLIAVILASVLFLLYLLSSQRAKNKELKFQKEQQEYNEEIYKLLLKQQTKLEEGRQEERARISGELHDGILGKLFGIRMNFGLLNLNAPGQVSAKYNQLLDKLQLTEEEIRQISHNLIREVSGSHLNFAKLLKQLVADYQNLTSAKIEFSFDDNIDGELIDENIQINYYRILQEALQNVVKHAEATLVNIKITREQDVLVMEIKDNGKGFDKRKKVKGIGLKNMRDRMEKIDGMFTFKTSAMGTDLLFRVKIYKNG